MKSEEILKCLILIVIGYFIAQLFSRCAGRNGFRVGAPHLTAEELCNITPDDQRLLRMSGHQMPLISARTCANSKGDGNPHDCSSHPNDVNLNAPKCRGYCCTDDECCTCAPGCRA